MNIRNFVLIQLIKNDHTYWGTQHASHIEVWHQRRLHIRDGPVLVVEDLFSPRDEYIRWYRDITRVYIGNPTNRETRTVGYQPAGVDRRMMGQLTIIHTRYDHVGGSDNSQ
ncbi:hypothetical protein M9H77_06653 [Catharanthus roseus]|uniref:Uncharacterized protein n=1 Tax=Catharanthus roseus TaxID=4058 RepID=A0ACC0BT38_CATRO|nr:hypothetical protein M9H77_06653 [Catharanthus roseus]